MTRFSPHPVRLSVACYRILLLAYPHAHRQAYGALMQQLFQDLCRDAYQQNGWHSLASFWIRTLFDFIGSLYAAYGETLEAIMTKKHSITPMPWHSILLVVLPGTLYALSRIYPPLGIVAGIAFLLVFLLVLGATGRQRQLPAWGMFMAGLAMSWGLFAITISFKEWTSRPWLTDDRVVNLLEAVSLWLIIGYQGWQYRQVWHRFRWVLGVGLLIVLGAALFVGMSWLTSAGFLLLPVALGLPLARRQGAAAVLFVVGAYSVWLFDSDTFNGWLLRDQAFYPVYAMLLLLSFMGVGPLLFLRAATLKGQIAGLLTPMVLMLGARVLVPWLIVPLSHPARIWRNDALLSVLTLLLFILALALYVRIDRAESAIAPPETEQPVYA